MYDNMFPSFRINFLIHGTRFTEKRNDATTSPTTINPGSTRTSEYFYPVDIKLIDGHQ